MVEAVWKRLRDKDMMGYIYSLFEGKERGLLNRYVFLSFCSPLMDLFGFSMVLLIMNRVLSTGEAAPGLILFTFGMALFSLGKSAFEIGKNQVANRVLFESANSISVRIYDLIMNEELKYHNEKDPMQALALVRDDAAAAVGILVKIIGMIVSGVTILGYSVSLIVYAGLTGALIVMALILFMYCVYRMNRSILRKYGEKRRQLSIRAGAQVTTAYGAFKEMKIDNRSAYLLKRYEATGRELVEVQVKYSLRSGMAGTMLREGIMVFLFLFLGILMLYQENLLHLMASMIIYIGILIKMIPVMYGVISSLNAIEYARKSYDSMRDCMERYKLLLEQREGLQLLRRKRLTFQQGLRVEGLTFGYSPDKKIFDDAGLWVPAGSSVAIIGASGSGKTTFLDLILGLHRAESGSVYYDDYEIVRGCDEEGECIASLGDIVSYIPQIVYLNGETVKHNVAFFEEDTSIDENRVVECLKIAQIWQDVSEMEDGIDTEIGTNGTIISGGQRQRIALARALYKEFDILIMDEATAALDMETEKAVIDSIRQVKGDKTLLMVTHHMSLANECDYVYKIENKGFVRVR